MVSAMNMSRLKILLALWCALMIAPALILQLGVLGQFDMKTNITGAVTGVWLVGYLAQFGIFLWLMNIVKEQRILWWFPASLLPWAIDWTVPVSPWFILLWLPATIAMAYWIYVVTQRAESLEEHGIRASGTVLEVLKPKMNVVINNVYIKRKVRLRIEREDGVPAYEGVLNGLFMLGAIPSAGDRMALLVDPANPQRFAYDDKKTASSQPTRVHAAAATATDRGNLADELDQLARLHERGVLTDSEFNAAKKKLLQN